MTESNTGSMPPEGTIRLTRFIILAGEDWSDEAMAIAWLRERGCTASVARKLAQFEEQVRELGENAAYVLAHQPSMNRRPDQMSGAECTIEIAREYYRIRTAKPGNRLWLLSVGFRPDEQIDGTFRSFGDVIDMWFREPLDWTLCCDLYFEWNGTGTIRICLETTVGTTDRRVRLAP